MDGYGYRRGRGGHEYRGYGYRGGFYYGQRSGRQYDDPARNAGAPFERETSEVSNEQGNRNWKTTQDNNWRHSTSERGRSTLWRSRGGRQRRGEGRGMTGENWRYSEAQRGRGQWTVKPEFRGNTHSKEWKSNYKEDGATRAFGQMDISRPTRKRWVAVEDLDKLNPHERLLVLSERNSKFLGTLDKIEGSEEDLQQIPSLMRTLAGVTECTHSNLILNGFLTDVLNTKFFRQRVQKLVSTDLLDIVTNNKWDESDVRTSLHNMFQVMVAMFNRVESLAFDRLHLVILGLEKLIECLSELSTDGYKLIDQRTRDLHKELVEMDSRYSANRESGLRQRQLSLLKPPDNFRDYPVIPGKEDIAMRADQVFLRDNRVKGKYQSVDDYLDVQFRLMREDFLSPLRKGISEYRDINVHPGNRKRISEVRIYRRTRVLYPLCLQTGVGHVVQIDITRLRRIQWERSKRLLFGSLVCFINDRSDDILLATIVNRDARKLSTRGEIFVQFIDWNINLNIQKQDYVMIESTAYFEAYRHILTRLQAFSDATIPFPEHLVDCLSVVQPPHYLACDLTRMYDFTCLLDNDEERKLSLEVNPLSETHWPTASDLGLDDSQYTALKNGITKRMAVIQGPPGTGKTFIGLKITRLLLENIVKPSNGEFGPILLVCYTNHALDQFLEGIVESDKDKIVRVGGQSRSEALKQFALSEIRANFIKERKFPPELRRQIGEIKERIETLCARFLDSYAQLEASSNYMLQPHVIKDCIRPNHFQAITGDDERNKEQRFRDWLLAVPAKVPKNLDAIVPEVGENILLEVVLEGLHQLLQRLTEQKISASDQDDAPELQFDDEAAYEGRNRGLEGDEQNQIDIRARIEAKVQELLTNDYIDITKGKELISQNKHEVRLAEQRELQKTDYMTEEEETRVADPLNIPFRSRWRLYRLWRYRYQLKYHEKVANLSREYDQACRCQAELHSHSDREVMKVQDVIAMTTTGAARYGDMLSIIKPKIIIVEEAAEVFESHVVSSLSEGCQHLILIGDHKQLQPSPAVYEMAKRYKLNVSLFERLIENKFHYDTLGLQHRMRPEISHLVRNSGIYPELEDDGSVLNYPVVMGVAHNVFFVNHNYLENDADDLQSYSNDFEAKYAIRLCRHFILQGYSPEKITILTLYTGQLFLLKRLITGREFQGLKVTVVDNYQGEENDIIILSLVRSNLEERIGFVGIDNRICVALSRARMGLYVMGNFNLLRRKSGLWSRVVDLVEKAGQIGDGVVLTCQLHPSSDRKIAKIPADFDKHAPKGGCTSSCGIRLKCGHVCTRACHPTDREHKQHRCERECGRKCERDLHPCQKPCYLECGKCRQQVNHALRCGHTVDKTCYEVTDSLKCKMKCDHRLPCGHVCDNGCGEEHTVNCKVKVDKVSPFCGHTVRTECWLPDTELCCMEPCKKTLACGHECGGNCWDCGEGRLHVPCDYPCERILVCGHSCRLPCKRNCQSCNRGCELKCDHGIGIDACGGKLAAQETCMEKCTNSCPHKACSQPCAKLCDKICNQKCEKKFRCRKCKKDIQCPGICGEKCIRLCRDCDSDRISNIVFSDIEDKRDALFIRLEHCGHIFEVSTLDKSMKLNENGGPFFAKRCPCCKTVVTLTSCRRYSNEIKRTIVDLHSVTKIVNDEAFNFSLKRRALSTTLDELQISILVEMTGDATLIQRILKQRYKKAKLVSELTVCHDIINLVMSLEKSLTKYKSLTIPDHVPQTWTDRLRHNIKSMVRCLSRRDVGSAELIQCATEAVRLEDMVTIISVLSKCTNEECRKVRLSEIWLICEKSQPYDVNTRSQMLQSLTDFVKMNQIDCSVAKEEKCVVEWPISFSADQWQRALDGKIYSKTDKEIYVNKCRTPDYHR